MDTTTNPHSRRRPRRVRRNEQRAAGGDQGDREEEAGGGHSVPPRDAIDQERAEGEGGANERHEDAQSNREEGDVQYGEAPGQEGSGHGSGILTASPEADSASLGEEMPRQRLDLRIAGIALAVLDPQDGVVGDAGFLGDCAEVAFALIQRNDNSL